MSTSGDADYPWKITRNARASNEEVRALVYEGINELAQEAHLVGKGLPFPVLPSDNTIFATSPDGDNIGLICYRRLEAEVSITLAYVEPSSRRQGVFRSLWEALAEREHDHREVLVKADMSVENDIGAEVATKMGFVKAYAGWVRLLKAD